MTVFTVARRYLAARPVASALTVAAVALGVALVIATALLSRGIREGFAEGATDFSLVAGAKGSPTQLVLNVVFRMDTPTPNISWTTYRALHDDPRVDLAVPVLMGDAYQGFRYVATSTHYFAARPWRRRAFHLASGRFFRDDAQDQPSYEALLGADVARRTGLRLGDRFWEGEEMAAYPLTVVGILAPTGSADDRAIFLSLATFWEMNEISRAMNPKPLTAVLVRPYRLSDLPALHRELNVGPGTQGVFPSAVLLGVFNLLRLVDDVLGAVLAIVALIVLLYLVVSMYSATFERRREIATMRALGARRPTIVGIVLLESSALAAVGGLVGILAGHGIAYLGALLLAARSGVVSHPFAVGLLQPVVFGATVIVGTVAGLLPAAMAYRTEVAENLAPLA